MYQQYFFAPSSKSILWRIEMNKTLRISLFILALISIAFISGCSKKRRLDDFPDFITSNTDYYVTRIGSVPVIDPDTYRLEITGLVDNPHSYTLEELYALDMVELPLTVECIGNAPEGPLISTAVWKGFILYDLLVSLGIDESATGVQYRAADGYYASHTMEQIRDNGIVGALYMNGEVIPAKHGFPLRILNPGYHGVKQPAWVTEIEVIDMPVQDYWEDRGWDCSPPMAIDSTIFFPQDGVEVGAGQPLTIGGAAFGGTRVTSVEVTADKGQTWQDAEIVQSRDEDNVWVFWQATLTFNDTGKHTINVRATDIHGNVQQETDPDKYDGANDWPVLEVKVVE
jgi:DMSO/TMAO reductase YedYZ molybdopterin-dependent catalytic subunit